MISKLVFAQILGYFAAIFSSLQHPSHVMYLVKHKENTSVLRGVSFMSLYLTTANSIMWSIYGFLYDAIPTALAGIAAMAVTVVTAYLLYAAKIANMLSIVFYTTFVVLVLLMSLYVSQDILGFSGNVISVIMWIPAAVKIVKSRGTPAGRSYPPATSLMIIATNIIWIVYGVLLSDIWLWTSSPISIVCALLMLYAYYSTKKFQNDKYRS